MISSSSSRRQASKSSSPLRVRRARSRMYSIFWRESPSARIFWRVSRRTPSGVTGSPAGFEVQLAAPRAPGQVADVLDFLAGESERPHLLAGEPQDPFRRYRFARCSGQTLENCLGGIPAQLLEDNGPNQRLKRRLPVFHAIRADPFDNGSKHRVGLFEVQN